MTRWRLSAVVAAAVLVVIVVAQGTDSDLAVTTLQTDIGELVDRLADLHEPVGPSLLNAFGPGCNRGCGDEEGLVQSLAGGLARVDGTTHRRFKAGGGRL